MCVMLASESPAVVNQISPVAARSNFASNSRGDEGLRRVQIPAEVGPQRAASGMQNL